MWEEKDRRQVRSATQCLTPTSPSPSATLLVSYFSGNVVTVNAFILQKHVKTALVLGQGVTCNSKGADTPTDNT